MSPKSVPLNIIIHYAPLPILLKTPAPCYAVCIPRWYHAFQSFPIWFPGPSLVMLSLAVYQLASPTLITYHSRSSFPTSASNCFTAGSTIAFSVRYLAACFIRV